MTERIKAHKKSSKKSKKATTKKTAKRRVVQTAPFPAPTHHTTGTEGPAESNVEVVDLTIFDEGWQGYAQWLLPLNDLQLRAVVAYEYGRTGQDGPLPIEGNEDRQELIEWAVQCATARHNAGDHVTSEMLAGSVFEYYTGAFEQYAAEPIITAIQASGPPNAAVVLGKPPFYPLSSTVAQPEVKGNTNELEEPLIARGFGQTTEYHTLNAAIAIVKDLRKMVDMLNAGHMQIKHGTGNGYSILYALVVAGERISAMLEPVPVAAPEADKE